MVQTVNERIKNEFKKIYKYNIVQFDNNVIEDLLHKILYTYKNELAEKDKVIELMNEQCDGAIKELQQTQLFKEDFLIVPDLNNGYRGYISKEKYYKLPSKDVK